MYHNMCL